MLPCSFEIVSKTDAQEKFQKSNPQIPVVQEVF